MRRVGLTALLALVLGGSQVAAGATPIELRDLVGANRPAGCSEYRFLFWDFYRAELWTDAAELPGERFALSLTYRTDFTRGDLVESSIDEMVRITGEARARFAEARAELARAFRDVYPGDRITAWREATDQLRFFVNGRETGSLTRDVDAFLSIWLGPETRHESGREALLTGRCDG